ncbi:unnamed protein product [Absidia cylindrospora]
MTNQAQKRPFASLMEQDYDNELNDNLSPQPSLSPIAHDAYTDDSIYTQQNNIIYNDAANKLIHHNTYDGNNYDSLLPQNTYQQQYHQPHHLQQQQTYLPNNSYQPSTPNSQPPSISLQLQPPPPPVQQQNQQEQHLTKQEQAYCIKTLTALMKHRKAIAFLQPVDVVAFNIPDYLQIVKQPMDLGTVSQKLNSHQYETVDAFLADIQLIFYNCYLYNNAQDPVSLDAKKLEQVFQKWLDKRPEPQPTIAQQHTDTTNATGTTQQQNFITNGNDSTVNGNTPLEISDNVMDEVTIMPDDQFKHCEATLKELKKSKHESLNWPFVAPVNAEAWGATDYYLIISKPMDLSTVERKLSDYEYANENEFEDDIRLIFKNCYAYNPPEHAVHQLGRKFEHVFESFWKKVHKKSSSKAKKDSKKQNKRIKLVAHDTQAATPITSVITPMQDSVNGYTTTTAAAVPTTAVSTAAVSTPPPPAAAAATTTTTTASTATPTNEEARPPTILRLKLTTKPKNEIKSNTPTPPPSTTPTVTTPLQHETKPPPKAPGLALSKEPPADSARPKLAIGNKTSPPPEKRQEKKAPIVLQNHDKWLALAQKSGSTDDFDNSTSTPALSANTSLAASALPKPKEAIPSPAKAFDITEFIDRMKHENRARDQQKRVVEEQRKEKDRMYMEKKHQSLRHHEEQRKEHKEWMEQQKRKDKETRLKSLVSHCEKQLITLLLNAISSRSTTM